MVDPITIEEQSATPTIAKESSFLGDVVKLVSGTTIAQIISILVSPILARLYTPEAIGLASIFISITAIFGVIACLRYEHSIMLPDRDDEAANMLGVSLGLATLVSAVTIPIIVFGGQILIMWLNTPQLSPYLWLLPPSIFLGGVYLALNYWDTRKKKFGRLSIARISSSLSTTTTQLGVGGAGYAFGGTLIIARVIGVFVSSTILGGLTWRDDRRLLTKSINWKDMLNGIRRYKKFPIYDSWSALLNTISWQLPIFLLTAFFSPAIAGFYALGHRVLRIPMSLIGQSMGQVFYQRAAFASNEGRLAEVVENVYQRLVKYGMFPMLLLSIIGADLFSLVFGTEWREAGIYVQILSIWTFFWFISSPLSTLFRVLEKQEVSLIINVIIFITRFVSLVIGGLLGNSLLAISLFAITGTLVYGYYSFAIIVEAGVSLTKAVSILLSNFLLFVPVGVILLFEKYLGINIWLHLLTAAIFLFLYFTYILLTDPQVMRYVIRFVPIGNKH